MQLQASLAALDPRKPAVRWKLARCVLVWLPLALLCRSSLRDVLATTGGTPAAPLDDAYIHFQFSRSFAAGEPLVYTPGTPPVAGATSLLYPILLALPYALGLREHSIVWAAWALGWLSLGLLATEAHATARKFAGFVGGVAAAWLMLAFGANAWFATSGMEVMPLAWLMLRAVRRAAEWCEGEFDGRERAGVLELVALSAACPLMRPEGAYASVLVACALALCPRRAPRWLALLPLLLVFSSPALNFAFTGSFVSTTARAKWLALNPYYSTSELVDHTLAYVRLLAGTLLNGELWTALFLPRGSAPFALASVLSLPLLALKRELRARATLLSLLALGSLIPATYECYLCNRVRYLWPFAPAFLLGVVALCELVASNLSRLRRELGFVRVLLLGPVIGVLAGRLPDSIDDVAVSARGIFDQQVSLGLWARDHLPPGASAGVNDTGAIAYFSGRRTFDVVGLTSAGEARYWTAGPGSRFEHYERLERRRLPSHFIVYPEWFALPPLLGQELTERYVPYATILGGQRMVAYEADYSLLGSAEAPLRPVVGQLIDRLDVADLESEASHGYALDDARKEDNALFFAGARLDGGRRERRLDSFVLEVAPSGRVLLRVGSELPAELLVTIGSHRERVKAPFDLANELVIEVPSGIPRGRVPVRVETLGERFTSLHYFSLAP